MAGAGEPFRFPLRVRFGDVDHAGIVYYPRFFHYFHVAFEELFFARAEGDLRQYRNVLDLRRIGLPAVRVECDFERPLRFGDLVEVQVTAVRLGEKSVTLRYQIFLGAERCCDGRVTCAAIDLDTFQSIPLSDELRRMFASIGTPGA